MPAIPANQKRMLLSTDYPLDKVVYITSGVLVVTSSGSESQTISHGLTFRPLMVFSHSDDPDFTVSRTNGLLPFGPAEQWGVSVDTDSDTTIRVLGFNSSSTSKTIYWRAYGFMPSTANEDAPFNAVDGQPLAFNTDRNYMKLFASGYIEMPASGLTTSVAHGLLYRPRVQIWERLPSGIERLLPLAVSDPTDTFSNRVNVTTSSIDFTRGSDGLEPTHYHYRIYLDD